MNLPLEALEAMQAYMQRWQPNTSIIQNIFKFQFSEQLTGFGSEVKIITVINKTFSPGAHSRLLLGIKE